MADRSRIIKVAGFSLIGFCAVSAVADKYAGTSNLAQIAGFCGAFTGALVGRIKAKREVSKSVEEDSAEVSVRINNV